MKTADIISDVALGILAFAGALTLLQDKLSLSSILLGSLFAVAFVLFLVASAWRLIDSLHPVKVVRAKVTLNTLGARRSLDTNKLEYPMIDLEMDFFSSAELALNKEVQLKPNNELKAKLGNICRLPISFTLQAENQEEVIRLNRETLVTAKATRALPIKGQYNKEMDSELEDIDLTRKCELHWRLLNGKSYRHTLEEFEKE